MRKYKIILCDYDGTLANSSNKISSENLIAINSFIKRGGIFVVCSGRATDAICAPLIRQGFKGLVASFNGAVLTDLDKNQTLYSYGIPPTITKKFFEYTYKNDLYAHFYPDKQFLYPYRTKYTDHYERVTGVKGICTEDILSYIDKTQNYSYKLLVFDDKEKLDKHFDSLRLLMSECEVTRSTDNMIDFNLKGLDKGNACIRVSNLFGLTEDDVLALGDAGNDIAMIKKAGFGVAVANASDEVKSVANRVVPSNDNDGVKYAIENFCI